MDFKRIVGTGILAASLLPTAIRAESPTWQVQTDEHIAWYVTTPELLVFGTGLGLYALAQEDGSEQWRLEIPRMHERRVDIVPYTNAALINLPKKPTEEHGLSILLDLETGKSIWTTEQTGLVETHGSYIVPPRDALLVYGKKIGADTLSLVLLDLFSGLPIWSVDHPFDDWPPDLFGDGAQPPLFDSEETMILFLNERSIRKYSLIDGSLIWETEELQPPKRRHTTTDSESDDFDSTPTLAAGYAPMVLAYDGRRFFAPHHQTLGAFSTFNGASRWLKPAALGGIPTQMERIPQGILLRTFPEDPESSGSAWISLLDMRTGHELWRSPRRKESIIDAIFGTWDNSTPFLVLEDQIVVAADDNLFSIDPDSGSEKKLCDLKFRGSDAPVSLEIRDDGYLVIGDQNAVWCEFDGQVRKRVYYDPPDGVGTGLLMLATAALVNCMDDIHAGNVTITIEASYSPGFEELLREYTATAEGIDYIYMLNESPEGDAIVRISKSDGEEQGRILVQTNEPDYQICPYTSNLFWKRDERTISCFAF